MSGLSDTEGRISQAVYGDSLENCSPEREAQVRILHPPLTQMEAIIVDLYENYYFRKHDIL